jgi:photosystem II stability/assembly factor-like uncharacterized protein
MRSVLPLAILCLLLAACAAEEPSGWIAQELGADAEFRDAFFLDSRHGWIVGGSHAIEGGIIGNTDDGGLTWRFRSGLARTTPRQHVFRLNAIWFVDERTGVIVADGGVILRTIDGGDHWHEISRGPRVSSHLFDLWFVDTLHGWAVGHSGVRRTTDGGATWHVPPGSGHGVGAVSGFAVHFLDRRQGFVVGSFGRIRRTADGGETWEDVNGPPASGRPHLLAIDFPDPEHGWVVGENGTILHTSDGGHTWAHQRSLTTIRLTDVRFIDGSRGWAVGFERADGTSTVLHTSDGGVTWVRQHRVEHEELYALFVSDAWHGWALGRRVRPGTQKLLRYSPFQQLE